MNRSVSAILVTLALCSCDADAEPGGGITVDPLCVTTDPCVEDFDCGGGARCNQALARPMCQEVTCAREGTLCDDDALCTPGLVCLSDRSCGRRAQGEACRYTYECEDGLFCPVDQGQGQLLLPYTDRFWSPDIGCIPVSYQAEAAWFLPELTAAFDEWTSAGCSRICFGEPVEVTGFDAARFTGILLVSDDGDGVARVVEGDHLRAVLIDPSRVRDEPEAHARMATRWVGEALNFTTSRAAGSAMNEASLLDAPTEADRADLCRWYPAKLCR